MRKIMSLISLFMVASCLLGIVTMAAETRTFNFEEDGVRCNPDGTIKYCWINDPNTATLTKGGWWWSGEQWTGAMWYNTALPDLKSKVTVKPGIIGGFTGWAEYTSPYSGLKIRDELGGTVFFHAGSWFMTGSYTQAGYCLEKNNTKVLEYYPTAVQVKLKVGWRTQTVWLVGLTHYIAHPHVGSW